MRHFWGATSLSYLKPKQGIISTYYISENVHGWLLTCFVHGLLTKNDYSGWTGHIKIWGAFHKFHKVPHWGTFEALFEAPFISQHGDITNHDFRENSDKITQSMVLGNVHDKVWGC